MTLSCQRAQCRDQREEGRGSPQAGKLGFTGQPEVPQVASFLPSLPCLLSPTTWGQSGLGWNTRRRDQENCLALGELPRPPERWHVCRLACRDRHCCDVPLGRHVRKPHPGGVVASQRGLPSSFGPPRGPHPEECQTSDVFFSCRCYRSQCPSGEMSEVIILWWVCWLLRDCQLPPQCWEWWC